MFRSLHLDSSTDKSIIILAFKLSYLLYLSHGYQTTKPHTFIYAGCSQEKYQPNSPFESNLNSFLASVLTSSSQFSYNSFATANETSTSTSTSTSTPTEATLYGLYQCRGDLQPVDCKNCIETSVQQIGLVCPYSFGASLQLEGCNLRYEHVEFLGKGDTSLRYRRCRRSVSKDAELFRRRDAVLGELVRGSGWFRVSRSGFVEGFGQCLGDLRAADCSYCLGEAVGKLKSLCGSASAADVFLGQCYARYRASGYYDETPDSSMEDRVGKATAIIVGLLAGLAILVVILSICQRAMGKK